MADATTAQQLAGERETGFFDHSRGFLAALTSYLSARLRILGIESKEAFVHYGIIIALAVGALLVLFLGYIFLCIALVVWIATALNLGVHFAILILAVVHIGVAVACLLIARKRLVAPMFTTTLAELKKDNLWLSNPPTAKQP